jgi:hypothetical protein
VAYDIDADYHYICSSLAVLIASVGGDETAAGSIDYGDLKTMINVTHTVPQGDVIPDAWTAPQRTTYRLRQRSFDNARKLIYMRDLLTIRRAS